MASLQDIRRRIRSVKNTQQITKAMKMISAVKLRKSQERLLSLRPYATKLLEIVRNVVSCFQNDEQAPRTPLIQAFMAPREEKRLRVVVVAGEKGLCGGFNANLLKVADAFLRERSGSLVHLDVVGQARGGLGPQAWPEGGARAHRRAPAGDAEGRPGTDGRSHPAVCR